MSIDVSVIYSEKPEEKFKVKSSGTRLKDFILNHERFEELSDEFKNKLISIDADDLAPYIEMILVISGVSWNSYCAPSWDRWGGDPGQEEGYEECKLDEFYTSKRDGELNIFDTFYDQDLKFTENDKSILLDMLVGESLIPTANAPFTSIFIGEGGEYELNVSNDFKKNGFNKWITDDDLARLDEDGRPKPYYDDDNRNNRSYGRYKYRDDRYWE